MTGMDEHNADSRSRESGSAPGGRSHIGQPGAPSAGEPASSSYRADQDMPGQPDPHGAGHSLHGYGQPGYGYPHAGQAGGWPGYQPGGYRTQPGYGQSRTRPRRRGLAAVISYVAVAALAAAGGGLTVALTSPGGSSPPAASAGLAPGSGAGAEPGTGTGSGASISGATVRKVENAVEPGLVVINSKLDDDPEATGDSGTGMIISRSGLVLTNNHVIDATNGLTATVVSTGRTYPARWLGYDKGSDVAVIKLDGASGLTTVPLGNSSAVRDGDDVVAMGNADGTGTITTTTGAITGLNQAITASDDGSGESAEHLTGMLQTDAQIIKGDSGGPLANTDGKVIGMDTAAASDTMTSQQDVGFAIPISTAMTIARQIIAGKAGGGVQVGAAGFAGVLVPSAPGGGQDTQTSPRSQLQQAEESAGQQPSGGYDPAPAGCVPNAADAGLPQNIAPAASGALVLGVLCQTPAAAAGLTAGDVITAAAGQQVTSPAALTNVLSHLPGGKKITITWVTPAGQAETRVMTLAQASPQ
jgi:S1-C subfamily serine protease